MSLAVLVHSNISIEVIQKSPPRRTLASFDAPPASRFLPAMHYRQLLSDIAQAHSSAVGRAAAAVNQGLGGSNPSRLPA